jgi:hypothetical protein
LKILHVTETLTGGIAAVITQLSKSSARLYVLVPDTQRDSMKDFSGEKKWFPYKKRSTLSLFYCYYLAIIECVRLKADVIHLHISFSLPVAPFLRLVGVAFGKSKIKYQPHSIFKFQKFLSQTGKYFL